MALRYPPHREQNIIEFVADQVTDVNSGTVISLENRTLVRLNSIPTSAFNFTLADGDRDGLYLILITEATNGHGTLQKSDPNLFIRQNFTIDTLGHAISLVWNEALGKWGEIGSNH